MELFNGNEQALGPIPHSHIDGKVAASMANREPIDIHVSYTVCTHSIYTNVAFILLSVEEKQASTDSLPPIGVFWDIENCAVPRGKSALAVVQSIRDKLFTGHREAEFLCVCDINKESATVIQELNDAQVISVFISVDQCGNKSNHYSQCFITNVTFVI